MNSMSPIPTLWFLRHGQTEWNRAYRLQGQLDSPLTEQGLTEARRQALIMPKILEIKPRIFVSPLGRARQTADIALAGAAYTTDPRLMEIDAGRWQGRYRADILAERPEWQANNPTALDIYEAAEGGEGIAAFHDRICSFVKDLSGPSVIVAHGLLGQVLRAHVRGIELTQAGQLTNRQGVVYLLENGQETVIEVDE